MIYAQVREGQYIGAAKAASRRVSASVTNLVTASAAVYRVIGNPMSKKALIIEDDKDLAELLAMELSDLGFESDIELHGADAALRALARNYALILLDLNLPGMNGLEICKQIRELDKNTPIIILTANAHDVSKILLIELGADDYLTKPFNPLELKARIKAILRRSANQQGLDQPSRLFRFRNLEVDREKRRVRVKGELVDLTRREFEILETLISSPGRPFSRAELVTEAYGSNVSGYEYSLSSHINRLREKLEEDTSKPEYIITVRGVGYCFADTE